MFCLCISSGLRFQTATPLAFSKLSGSTEFAFAALKEGGQEPWHSASYHGCFLKWWVKSPPNPSIGFIGFSHYFQTIHFGGYSTPFLGFYHPLFFGNIHILVQHLIALFQLKIQFGFVWSNWKDFPKWRRPSAKDFHLTFWFEVIAWGDHSVGGDVSPVHSELQSGVLNIWGNAGAFVAAKDYVRVGSPLWRTDAYILSIVRYSVRMICMYMCVKFC